MSATFTRTLSALVAFTLLTAAAHAQVVINEIHYDPADVTKQEEFIELHNAGASAVDVSGWRIEDAVAFTFPAATSIPAGGYVVVAQNTAHFLAKYGTTPLGPWAGVLANKGERITIKDTSATVVDEVNYGSGFPWPTAARGAGNSMELIHPSLDNTLGGSWRASVATPDTILFARGSGGWSYRPGSSEASAPVDAWRAAAFVQDGTWVTNRTTPIGYGEADIVAPVIAGMQNVYWSIFLRKTFTLTAGSIPSRIVLRGRADDGVVAWVNGTELTPRLRVNAAAPVFNGGAAGTGLTTTNVAEPAVFEDMELPGAPGVLQVGTNVVAIHVFNTTLNSSDLLVDAELVAPGANGGTPGAANTVVSATAPPQIRQVEHAPEQPAANVPVLVTAKITDPQGVASATLGYQLVDPGAYIRKTDAAYTTTWTNVAMNDAGTGGDALAGDGIFSATMPAALQTHRRLIRYRISASDGTTAITVPYADDDQPNFAYFVYNGVPAWTGAVQIGAAAPRGTVNTFTPALLNTMQTWQIITNASDHDYVLYSNPASATDPTRFYATFIYEGKVYDHIQYHNRGIGSTYVSGKNKFALFFNRARNVRMRDDWGKQFNEEWNSIPVDACASPWAAVHRGMAGVEEAIGYRLYELAGMSSLRTTYLHLRVIRNTAETGATQYDTDFWGLYMALEPTEGNFLDERNLADGNVYAIEGANGDKKHQGPTQPTTTTDWTTYRAAAALAGQNEAWYRANVDLQTFYTFFALNRFCGNVDVRPGDNYRYYHRPTDDRWLIIPYDLDMMSLPGHHWGGVLDGVSWAGATSQSVLLSRHTALAIEFRNRAREMFDLLASDSSVSGGQIAQLVDEYAQMVNPTGVALTWADADEAMWNNHPRTATGGMETNHKNNFFRTPYSDARGSAGLGTFKTDWTRTLPDPDGNGYGDHEGSMSYLKNFMTNAWPGGAWLRSNGNPLGYGYKYLEWESLYGGWGNINAQPTTADLAFPNTPIITYAGPVGFPANALDFTSSAFSPATAPNGGTTFSAMQWRIGEISAPGIAGYVTGTKRKYEVEQVWTSAEITPFTATTRVPLAFAEPGKTYRARVRHKDANGRWSHWSAPITFIAGTPDVGSYTSSLVISEVNYNPAPVTPAEFGAGFSSDDFEWVEVKNVSALPVDMSGLRFTKGVDFDFPNGWTIPSGGFALVVRNLAAFQMRYGNSFNAIIAGVTPDNLNNAGEQLKLSYGVGTPVVDFTYSDLAPWPVTADGTGKTLALRNVATLPDPTVPTNWKSSYATGGSPGADDVLTFDIWKADYTDVTDLLGDNDGEGILNLLEYALAANPLANDLAPLPTRGVQNFTVLGVPGDYLTLTFTRRTDASDLTFHAEFTTDLTGAWTPGVLETSTPGVDIVTETWRSPSPLSAEPKQFGRLRVVKP